VIPAAVQHDGFLWQHEGFRRDVLAPWRQRAGAGALGPFFGGRQSKFTFAMGPSVQGLGWHHHNEAVLQVLHGSKHWALFPPWTSPPGGTRPLAFPEWNATYGAHPRVAGRMERCVQRAGEWLYLPTDWFHSVLNVGETIAVGMQQTRSGGLPSDAYGRCSAAYSRARNAMAIETLSAATSACEAFVRADGKDYVPALASAGILRHFMWMGTRKEEEMVAAKELLRRAFELDPGHGAVAMHYGACLADRTEPGAESKALAVLRVAHSLQPGDQSVAKRLARQLELTRDKLFYRDHMGQAKGPYTREQLQGALDSGAFGDKLPVSDDRKRWRPITEVLSE